LWVRFTESPEVKRNGRDPNYRLLMNARYF